MQKLLNSLRTGYQMLGFCSETWEFERRELLLNSFHLNGPVELLKVAYTSVDDLKLELHKWTHDIQAVHVEEVKSKFDRFWAVSE